MSEALVRHDASRVSAHVLPGAAVAHARLSEAAGTAEEEGACAAIHGMPRWLDAGLAARAKEQGDAAVLLAEFLRRGAAVVDVLGGRFVLAVLAPGRGQALLATDRMGSSPLVWAEVDDGIVFGSTGDALQAHPDAHRDLDPQGLYHYLYFGVVPSPGTVRRDHRRLLPAERIFVHDGQVTRDVYWKPVFEDAPAGDLDACEERFRDLVKRSVQRLEAGPETGFFLSGGTDSSTLAGMYEAATGRRARTYSIGFDVDSHNEMEYARLAARHFRTDHHEYFVTPADVLDAIPRIAAIHADPFGNESSVPVYFCARLAREDGVERLLAGDGGDELFAGNSRYAKELVFERYGMVPRPVRALLETVLPRLPLGDRVWLVRKAQSYIRQARVGLPRRMHSYNPVERVGAEAIFDPGFLARVDPELPHRWQQEVYDGVQADRTLERMLGFDLKFTLADNDLPKVDRACELAGVEVAYPFLDDELVAFAASLPSGWKLKDKQLRWFFKHALREFLPREILAKKKHGFGLPFGIWLREDSGLRELADENLRAFRRRGLIRPEYLDELLRLHRTEHATYYGVQIWNFMMLEQWLMAHEKPVSVAG